MITRSFVVAFMLALSLVPMARADDAPATPSLAEPASPAAPAEAPPPLADAAPPAAAPAPIATADTSTQCTLRNASYVAGTVFSVPSSCDSSGYCSTITCWQTKWYTRTLGCNMRAQSCPADAPN